MRHLSYPRLIVALAVIILVAAAVMSLHKIPRWLGSFYFLAFSASFLYLSVYLPTTKYMTEKSLRSIVEHQSMFYDKYVRDYKEKHPGTLEYVAARNLGHIPVYYINLDRSSARRELLESKFRDYGLSPIRVPAVDGKKIKNIKGGSADGINFVSSFSLTPYEVACTLSHFRAIERARDDGHDLALVLEDDMAPDLIPYWEETLHQVIAKLPEDWTVINLNPSCELKKLSSYSKRHCWSAEAYLINRKGMEHILKFKTGGVWTFPKPEYGRCSGGASDCVIYAAIPGAYSYNYPLFFSSPLPSDVGNSDVRSYLKSNRKVNKFIALKNKYKNKREPAENFERA